MYDSHVDTPSQLIRLRDLGKDNPYAHVDFPKLRRGGVKGAFFALYTPPGTVPDSATRYALEMISAVNDCLEAHPDIAAAALSPADAKALEREGKFAVFLGMENGAPIQESLPLLRTFYRLGVRYVTLTHNADNSLADSAAEGRRWGGLSPFGKEALAQMNRLGVMVDLSHASDATFWDCIRLSEAPVIASHSSCRAICHHRRNLSDEMLQAIGEKGGYVGINLYPAFLSDDFGKRADEIALLDEADAVEEAFIACPADRQRLAAWQQIQSRLLGMWRPGVKEIVDHIDHAVRLAGLEHVGIGTDFDGIQVPPQGVEDCSMVPAIWEEMHRRGYSEKQISLISGENLLAVFDRVINCAESIS